MPALNADSSRVISSSEFVCLLLRVGWSALIRLDRVDHVGIFTMNDPPGEASHGTPLINKTGEIEYTGITPIPISVKWHSFNQSSPPLSLSLASSHTFWPQSLTLPLPLLHLTSNLVAPERSYWDSGFDSAFSMREITPMRALTNPSLASSTGWLHTAFCLTMVFRKQDPSLYHSIERTSHTESFN